MKSQIMDLPSQLLMKDMDIIRGSNILIFNAPADIKPILYLEAHLPKSFITLFNLEYSTFQYLSKENPSPNRKVEFGSWHNPSDKYDTVIIYLPKTDLLIQMVLNIVKDIVKKNGQVFVVGHNNAGIRSAKKDIEKFIGPIEYSNAARHSVIYQATKTQPSNKDNSLQKWLYSYEFGLSGKKYHAVSYPGVFSYGKLDSGTRILLENLEIKPKSKVLDWGSGSGVIGLVIKKKWPDTQVDMVDSNALALEATKKTMELNGLPTKNIWPSDVFSDIKGNYDLIISNPPFHSGVETDYSAVENFIAQAKQHLNPKGELRIVANIFLRYQPLVKKQFGHCSILAENKSYRVYQAIKQ